MKRIYYILFTLTLSLSVFSQVPDRISYQAVIRNNSGELVTGFEIGLRISILKSAEDTIPAYSETLTPLSNQNGLISIEIGSGTPVKGLFPDIDWSAGPWFIKTEADPEGGNNYTISGVSQILTVPYAIHSRTAENLTGDLPESDPLFSEWDKSAGINISEAQIRDLDHFTPEDETDPVFANSTAAKIRNDLIQNWNLAFKWGNHAEAGYVPGARTITINGTSNSLSRDPSWRVGTVESISAGNGIKTSTGNPIVNNGEIGLTGQALEFHNLNSAGLVTRTANGDILSRSLVAGNGITIEQPDGSAGNPKISVNFGGQSNTVAAGDHTHKIATTISDGFMSSEDKSKIDKIKTYEVGDVAQGGIVIWVDESGQNGLVCAFEEQESLRWDANGETDEVHASGDGPFSGAMNTMLIIAAQSRLSNSLEPYAALVCNKLVVEFNGKRYGDWYLPSKTELQIMAENKTIINEKAKGIGGDLLQDDYYWSSTEGARGSAYIVNMESGFPGFHFTSHPDRVRAVRRF